MPGDLTRPWLAVAGATGRPVRLDHPAGGHHDFPGRATPATPNSTLTIGPKLDLIASKHLRTDRYFLRSASSSCQWR